MNPSDLPPATLGELATLVEGRLRGASAGTRVSGVSSVDAAGPSDITWVSDQKFARSLSSCRAAAVILSEPLAAASVPAIVVADPEEAIARVLERPGGRR